MKKIICLIALTLMFSVSTHAETQYTVGLGYQYGGVLGAQVAYIDGNNKYFASLGLIGAALGAQRVFGSERKHSFGVVIGKEELTSEDGFTLVTYNYHASGFNNTGLVFGLSAGVKSEDAGFYVDYNGTKTDGVVMINIGYKF